MQLDNRSINGGAVATALSPRSDDQQQHTGPDVYRAIAHVSRELSRDGIGKGRRNESQGFAFRGIDDIMNALSALLVEAGLVIIPRCTERTKEQMPAKSGGILFYVTVKVEYDFVSVNDGSMHMVSVFGEAMDSGDKATNKAMSAAYKYCALQTFCIPTEAMPELPDADATTHEPQAQAAKSAPQPKPVPAPTPTPANPAGKGAGAGNTAEKRGAGSSFPWGETLGDMARAHQQFREILGECDYFRALNDAGFPNWEALRKFSLGKKPGDPTIQKVVALFENLCVKAVR